MPDTATRTVEASEIAGRFWGLRRLGSGATASVYSARESRGGSPVAVKVLHPSLARDGAWRRRFRTESLLLGRVRHPCVPRLLAASHLAARPWYAMELEPGATLAQRLATGPIPPGKVALIGRALAHALTALHAAGIIHADVKPANVVLRPTRPAALIDFGAARLAADSGPGPAVAVFGSFGYVAPEILLADARPDVRADLYSLGATLHAAITGIPLDDVGTDALDAALASARRPALDPRFVIPTCPDRLAEAILTCTRRRPEHRPQSAAAAHALLARVVETLDYPHAA